MRTWEIVAWSLDVQVAELPAPQVAPHSWAGLLQALVRETAATPRVAREQMVDAHVGGPSALTHAAPHGLAPARMRDPLHDAEPSERPASQVDTGRLHRS